MSSSRPRYNIVVSGDVIVDHHIYRGTRGQIRNTDIAGVRDVREIGGAAALHRLIEAVLPGEDWAATCAVTQPDLATIPREGSPAPAYSMAIWTPKQQAAGSKIDVWRADPLLGYGGQPPLMLPEPAPNVPQADVLVLDDGGFKFRLEQQRACWMLENRSKDCWTLLKMSDPVARGDLWHRLAADITRRNFVCLMSAQDLRRESVAIRQGVSWERTLEEVHNGLRDHPVLAQLQVCQHLVIAFSVDGALWLNRSGKDTRAVLVFDPTSCEGGATEEQKGWVVGNMSTMATAVARSLALHVQDPSKGTLDLAGGIAIGLAAMRDLQLHGHGQVGEKAPRGFPAKRVAARILDKNEGYATTTVPWPEDGAMPNGWTIAETSEHPLALSPPLGTIGLARLLACYGKSALKEVPHARFGDMVAIDRPEIEALRSLRRSMREYGAEARTKPFSIGVFGPPGAGKSYGVKQLAYALFGKAAWLEFNLSQFTNESDLRGAFHRIRDVVLSGLIPVVFWDEFDSENYKWLRHLLAPMQDGRFQDGQLNHAVGRAIFVFAGGTSEHFSDFGPAPDDAQAQSHFRLLKGPDFLSRLDAYYDVSGPNQRRLRVAGAKTGSGGAQYESDPTDVIYPLRRALLIRHHLGYGPDDKERIDFDSDLLDALLLVPRYHHGSRSLEKLVQPLRPTYGRSVRRSALPTTERMQMHVDAEVFHRIMGRLDGFRRPNVIDPIAAAIHHNWLHAELAAADPAHAGPTAELNRRFNNLSPVDQQNNRAAARRIPEILALAGLTIRRKSFAPAKLSEADVEAQLKFHLDRLAEAEHEGWMSQRVADGWTKGERRSYLKREHELIIPYQDLPPENKKKDESAVLTMWRRLDEQHYQIVWLDAAPGV